MHAPTNMISHYNSQFAIIPFFKTMRQNIKITTIVITINTTITDSTTNIIIVHGIISSLEDTVMGKNYKQHIEQHK